ncbi:MAG: hypothetical protein O7D30_09875 [Rickettsia endosymbiont of Ixodes persulcatus]|nr:hypothetical protein [Rickettsia endosymbiont of Ixodes persulcatus]
MGKQGYTLWRGINEVRTFLEELGIAASPEKIKFVFVHSGPQQNAEKTRGLYNLNLAGEAIKRSPTIPILGLFVDQDSKAGTWMDRVKRNVDWYFISSGELQTKDGEPARNSAARPVTLYVTNVLRL